MSRRERPRPTTRRPESQETALRSGAAARGQPGRVRTAPAADRRFFQALLPLRFFIGATFLYAGIDKFLDPRFLNAAGPGSIAEQLTAFTHESPLAGLVTVFALPNPVLIGVLMAIAEIAIRAPTRGNRRLEQLLLGEVEREQRIGRHSAGDGRRGTPSLGCSTGPARPVAPRSPCSSS